MEIMHHVGFGDMDRIEDIVNALGIPFKKTKMLIEGNFVATMEISEASPAWRRISQLIGQKRLLDIAYTLYEEHEVLAASWVRFIINNERGYPQPEGGNRWRETSVTMRCPRCISRFDQKAPYHIKQEPKMGRFDFMSLYWTYVMFATPTVLAVFSQEEYRGYEKWPVIVHRTGKPAESIQQVYIPNETSPGLVGWNEPDGAPVCPECHYVVMFPIRRGPINYRRDAFPEGTDFARSHEWFGGTPHQEIFISHRVAKAIIENGWRGAVLEPVELI